MRGALPERHRRDNGRTAAVKGGGGGLRGRGRNRGAGVRLMPPSAKRGGGGGGSGGVTPFRLRRATTPPASGGTRAGGARQFTRTALAKRVRDALCVVRERLVGLRAARRVVGTRACAGMG